MSSKYPPSWLPLPDTLPIKIESQNFQGIFLWVKKNIIHDIRNDHVLQVSSQEPSMSSKSPPSWPPLPDTLPIEISAPNFQGNFLWVKKHHSWCKGSPCHPYLRSGTLNILKVPPFLTPHFLPHFQLRYQHKIFRLCSLLPKSYLYPYHFKTNLDQPQTNVNPNQTFAPSKYPQP